MTPQAKNTNHPMMATVPATIPALKDWDHKDVWRRRGNGFCIEVSRHSVDYSRPEQGVNRWCVYAYIYPTHPRFLRFDSSDGSMYQDAATELPLHARPSFLQFHTDGHGVTTSIQVGADYNHLHDDHFTHYATAEDAMSVFLDADDLAKFLAAESTPDPSSSPHYNR